MVQVNTKMTTESERNHRAMAQWLRESGMTYKKIANVLQRSTEWTRRVTLNIKYRYYDDIVLVDGVELSDVEELLAEDAA